MREIKFRAWDQIDKEMIVDIKIFPEYGWLVQSDNDPLCARGRPKNGQMILMQFTGLLDKSGAPIYEGDIVKYKFYSNDYSESVYLKGEVSYYVGEFRVNVLRLLDVCNSDDGCEVIGNIYENSDLLENPNK